MQLWLLLTAFIVMVVAIRRKATIIEPQPVTVMPGATRRGTATKTLSKPIFSSLSAVMTTIQPWWKMGRRWPSQNPRDTTCSIKFQELNKDSAFSPEKFLFADSSGITNEKFCLLQSDLIMTLSDVCHVGSTTEGDNGAASAEFAISMMMGHFCHQSASLKVQKDPKCADFIKKATIACLPKSGGIGITGAVVYPSDLLITMLKDSVNMADICNTKNCIRSEMQEGACSAEQQVTILQFLDSLVSMCPTETVKPTLTPTTPKGPASTTTNKATRSTSYSDRPFTDKNGRETRADTGCMEWRNLGRSFGSACDDAADYMCSQRIPPTDVANCWAVKDDSSCCKKVKILKGRYSLTECLSDCTRDHTVCRERHPATKAAKCSVRPSSTYGTTCCVAEFIYT